MGVPYTDVKFYPTILGAVLFGIGIALMIVLSVPLAREMRSIAKAGRARWTPLVVGTVALIGADVAVRLAVPFDCDDNLKVVMPENRLGFR